MNLYKGAAMTAMTKLAATACVLCLALTGPASAVPSVSSVAGDTSHGGSLTITGSGFGTKATAAPYKYDDFEGGTLGARVGNGWYTSSNLSDGWPIYSDAHARASGIADESAYLQHDRAYNSTIGVTGLNWDYGQEVYLSCWYYCTTAGAQSRNFKILAFRGGGAGNWDGPDFRADMYPNQPGGHAYVARPDKSLIIQDWGLGGHLLEDGWHRVELFMHTGTSNSSDNDGVCLGWRDLNRWWTLENFEFDFSTQNYDNIYFAAYFARDDGTPRPQMWWYWDEIYIDTTQARVEIGNASTWSACTHREIQIPSAWSSSSITVTVNQGSFANAAPAYLYVVDQDGNANAAGYPITIGGPVMYNLSVTNGSGDGQYATGTVVAISADPAPSGKAFGIWVGDSANVADLHAASTTVTMPAADVSLTAGYVWVYQLTVNSGSGDGSYMSGTVVDIAADPAGSGQSFDQWTGDVADVADTLAAATTITMPPAAVEVTATYKPIAIPGDLNGDGFVGQGDLDIVLDQWGCGDPPAEPITDGRADPSGDGFVGQADLDIVLDHWGEGL